MHTKTGNVIWVPIISIFIVFTNNAFSIVVRTQTIFPETD